MKSLTNLRKGLALVLCAAMLMGDTTMLQAAQVEATTVGAVVSESKAETEVAEDVPAEVTEQEEAEVVEPQAEATEVSEAEEKSEETQVEAPDVETALENKALEATYTATVGETTVTVVAPEGAFTEEVTLQVTEVEITDEMQAQLDEQAIAEQKAINSASAYDISFVNAEGKEVEPAKEVQVSIATAEVNSGDDASVYHFDEEKAAVADMDATVVESGDVAFGTDHFSTYVIVNKGGNTVKVTIHHDTLKDDGKTREIYKTDVVDLPVGGRIKDYAKASNWKVQGLFIKNEDGTWSQMIPEEQIQTMEITRNLDLYVRYQPKVQEVTGEVTFWDYTIKPGNEKEYYIYKYSAEHTYYYDWDVLRWYPQKVYYGYFYTTEQNKSNVTLKYFDNTSVDAELTLVEEIRNKDSEAIKKIVRSDSNRVSDNPWNENIAVGETIIPGYTLSINADSNYAQNSRLPKLTVGKSGGGSQNSAYAEGAQVYPENNHMDYLNEQAINAYKASSDNGVIFSDTAPIKTGIVKGLDDNGEVLFNVNQPGVFTTTDSVGKKVYNNGEYHLVFRQEGDHYKLDKVVDKNGNKVADGGNTNVTKPEDLKNDFFPLDSVKDSKELTGDTHNCFFGMRYDIKFTIGDYNDELNYSFTGDDDLWVLLDGKVVIDIGGIHGARRGTANLWDYIEGNKDNCDRSKEHTLTVLYMERGGYVSNCGMDFTVPNARIIDYSTPTADLEFTKVDSEDNTKALKGATFKLERLQADGKTVDPSYVYPTIASGEDGKVKFSSLVAGSYLLTETIAPEGYELLDESKQFNVTIDANGVARIYDADGKEVKGYKISNEVIEEPVVPTFDLDKTVKATGDNKKREYEITLTANSTTQATSTTTSGGPVDVILLLDQSKSMDFKLDREEEADRLTSAGTYGQLKSSNGRLVEKYYYDGYIGTYELDEHEKNGVYSYTYNAYGWDFDVTDNTELSKYNNRLNALKSSVAGFLNSMANKSPESKVGIISFSSSNYNGGTKTLYSLQPITNNPQNAITAVKGMSANGGTSPYLALNKASEQFVNDGRKRIVVLFTDGIPTGNGNEWNTIDAGEGEAAATALKNDSGVTIYTVGFALGDKGKNWLSNKIASSPAHALTADTQDELTKIFESISQTITNNLDIENATITDVLDPRFELVVNDDYDEKARLEADGATVTVNTDSTTTITWKNQPLPYDKSKQWTKTIKIKAKDDFLGGNKVPTNITPDSGISIGEEGEITPFPQPTVNVKLLSIDGTEKETTVFLGDEIKSSGFYAELEKSFTVNGEALPAEVEYVYPGTADVVGKITFTKTKDGKGASEEDHTAKYVGSPAETYSVTATYTPYKVSERPATLAAPAANAGTEVTTGASATSTYKVNVVAGKLTINKTISNADYKAAFGDPVFTFKITNDKGKTYYRTLRFSEIKAPAEGENPTDVTLTATITDLPSGNYKVKEMPTLGFELKDLTATGTNAGKVEKNKSDKEATFSFAYVDKQTEYTATVNYTNVTKHSPRDTDTDVVKNHFHVENGTVTITPDKNVDNGTTTDTSGRNVTTNN
ncbi:fibro-slime domain-containing protein [Lachnospiraceae bacterium XBD2001]|nr:fibro-slime domain-containing protein [Lachnospiraceae bacterium XBD2001]